MNVIVTVGALLLGAEVFLMSHFVNSEVPVEELRCPSVAGVDLGNARIGRLRFTKGRACTFDDLSKRCDWEHRVTRDEILRPVPGREVRLVVINSHHLTGSGAWDRVVVFDCVNGVMKAILEKSFLYGVRIEHAGEGEIIFVSGKWGKRDPMCCPSEERSEVYRWDEKAGKFNLTNTTIKPQKNRKK